LNFSFVSFLLVQAKRKENVTGTTKRNKLRNGFQDLCRNYNKTQQIEKRFSGFV